MSDEAARPAGPGQARTLRWSGYALGFSLGGFFDGILLHQVLQWHHLLSALQREPFGDLRVQVLADGLFHLLMYLIAAAGLWLLWRARHGLGAPGSGRSLAASLLIGFGAWHIADALLSHWLLGIHRIRMDSSAPLAWDLGWLIAFGIVPALAGWWLTRRPPAGGGAGRGRAVAAAMVLAVLSAAPLAALPPATSGATTLIVFRPGIDAGAATSAIAAAGGRPVWSDPAGGIWAAAFEGQAATLALYRGGALLVGASPVIAGCLAWTRA